jgi:hypothetical protein
MVIVALDHVPHCYSSEDGRVIHDLLDSAIHNHSTVRISFAGVSDVPSSFINAALVPFVLDHGLDWVKEHVFVVSARRQVIDMIKFCFSLAERSKQVA